MGWLIAATCWGFGEATLFFILPDVILTTIAVESLRRGLTACAYALVGALIGGTLMYCWGAQSPDDAATAVSRVPLIGTERVADVRTELADHGVVAVITGPINGTPYKIYAVEAHRSGTPYPEFIAASVPARSIRFVGTTVIAWAASRYLLPSASLRTKYILLASVWTLIYVAYTLANT
ncbi:MAG: hypothetical protein ACRDTD_26365 [Pseudonocardiaceae bacterium]